MKTFRAPRTSLGVLDAEATAALIAAATDVAMVVDQQGVVQDIAFQNEQLGAELAADGAWLGRPWIETVTADSRAKVDRLLHDAGTRRSARWRHLNHPVPGGPDIPILYSALKLADGTRTVVFGRDLRPVSELQQRLVEAQQSMERDYTRIRHVETRYRLLFQTATDAVLIVDAATLRVVDANPIAQRLIGSAPRRALGPRVVDLFDADGARTVESLLATVRAAGRPDDVRARLAPDRDGKATEIVASAALFREEQGSLFLLRLAQMQQSVDGALVPKHRSKLLKIIESAPDGFVVANIDGQVVSANAAFLDMIQVPNEEQVREEPLDRWLGRSGVDVEVLISHLRQHGSVRLFASTLQGEYGAPTDVEISGTTVMNGEQPCYGFVIRASGRRLATESPAARALPRSVEQLTELIGRVALKDLVRDATDMIERMCIEAALRLTDDNRASAAEMLGLSRQSLYVKLRRYGLGDLPADGTIG